MDAPGAREALLAWWTASLEQLMSALHEPGRDRSCWTWWDDSPSPQTARLATLAQLYAQGDLHLAILATFPLDRAADASAPTGSIRGKIVITVG